MIIPEVTAKFVTSLSNDAIRLVRTTEKVPVVQVDDTTSFSTVFTPLSPNWSGKLKALLIVVATTTGIASVNRPETLSELVYSTRTVALASAVVTAIDSSQISTPIPSAALLGKADRVNAGFSARRAIGLGMNQSVKQGRAAR